MLLLLRFDDLISSMYTPICIPTYAHPLPACRSVCERARFILRLSFSTNCVSKFIQTSNSKFVINFAHLPFLFFGTYVSFSFPFLAFKLLTQVGLPARDAEVWLRMAKEDVLRKVSEKIRKTEKKEKTKMAKEGVLRKVSEKIRKTR